MYKDITLWNKEVTFITHHPWEFTNILKLDSKLEASDPEIGRIVYELFGLTEEEYMIADQS